MTTRRLAHIASTLAWACLFVVGFSMLLSYAVLRDPLALVGGVVLGLLWLAARKAGR